MLLDCLFFCHLGDNHIDILKRALQECGVNEERIAKILLEANSEEVKASLKAATQDAKDRGNIT